MRTRLVVGNWKMNNTIREAAATVEAFVKSVSLRDDVDVAVCPPYLAIARVRELLMRTSIKLGAQDVFWEDRGAFTGKVSASMLYDAGCSYCIVGHSETRGRFGKLETDAKTLGYFCETDYTIGMKMQCLLYQSITPILCVGENEDEREAGHTDQVIKDQLEGAFEPLDADELHGLVVAYEPVWAIGTGKTCDATEAERVCGFIRERLKSKIGEGADYLRILYGGSVKSGNARELFSQPNIDGGLVGGASLDAEEFSRIVAA